MNLNHNILCKNATFIISLCSLTLSIIAICVVKFRTSYITIEWANFLVSVLAILVAVLAIYLAVNYFYFEKKINKSIEDKTHNIQLRIDNMMQSLDHTVTGIAITVDTIHGEYYRNEIEIALKRFMEALKELSESNHSYGIDLTMRYLYGIKIQEEKSAYPMLDITKDEKKEYISILMTIRHRYSIELIGFINNIKEK